MGSTHKTSVGIDLGTVNITSVSCSNLTFKEPRHIRACVAVGPKGALHTGERARASYETNPRRGVSHLKDFIGQIESHWKRTIEKERRPFRLQEKSKLKSRQNPEFVLEYHNAGATALSTSWTLKELLAQCFRDVALTGPDDSCASKSAVIAVPHLYKENGLQRNAITDAGRYAGFDVVNCLDESIAAVLGCVARSLMEGDGLNNVDNLIICNGGFHGMETTLFRVENGSSLTRHQQLFHKSFGGWAFLEKLIGYCENKIRTDDAFGPDVQLDDEAYQQLRFACEKAQENLSMATTATIEVRSLANGANFVCEITREDFEDLCGKMMCEMSTLLRMNALSWKVALERCEVIAVGGLFRMPMLQRMIGWMSEKKVNSSVMSYGQDVVAYGAAAAAELLLLDSKMYKVLAEKGFFDAIEVLETVQKGRQPIVLRLSASPKKEIPVPDIFDGNIMFYDNRFKCLLNMLGPVQISFKSEDADDKAAQVVLQITHRESPGKTNLVYRGAVTDNVRLEAVSGKDVTGTPWHALMLVDGNNQTVASAVEYPGLIFNQYSGKKQVSGTDILEHFQIIKKSVAKFRKMDRSRGSSSKQSVNLLCPLFLANIIWNGTPTVQKTTGEALVIVELVVENEHNLLCYQFPAENERKTLIDFTTVKNLDVYQNEAQQCCRVDISGEFKKSAEIFTLTVIFRTADMGNAFEREFRKTAADRMGRKARRAGSPEVPHSKRTRKSATHR